MKSIAFLSAVKTLCLAGALGGVLLSSGGAFAQTVPATPPMPEVLEELASRGAQVRFLGSENGLNGWATILQGQEQYFYVTPNGDAVLMGLLFDKTGRAITVEQVARLQQSDTSLGALSSIAVPEPEASDPVARLRDQLRQQVDMPPPAEQMMADIEAANVLTLGKADAPVVYAFVDPQCPHCHSLMQDLRKDLLPQGKIQVKLIPVGLRDDTKAQAAYMLAAPDATDRWYRHLDGDKDALPVDSTLNRQGVERNLIIMQNWKFDATPIMVYRDRNGAVKIVRGRPRDLNQIVADLL